MFANLIRRLTDPAPAPLPDDQARLALCALMVRIARADGTYATTEIARIDQILARRFGLDPGAAARLRGEAEVLERDAPDTVRFARAIKQAVPYADRASVVEALWEIALADGARDEHENQLLRLVAPMLGLTDPDSALARQRAVARAGRP